ncbi:MAG: PD-(D/E)XK nuclease family protein [Candidatus Sumerlaeia bacterium]|nr:PD-(D/E)XK nuclease family protein [Candidatus Sumerlaeia bacterium]
MALQFIFGRAGSGKTHLCLEAVREQLRLTQRGPALVLLVPEQATYQTERALVATPGLGGYSRARVLSFRRLAYEVLLEVGGAALPPIEAAGKQMVLRAIVRRRSGQLRLFGQSARQRGFVERLTATLSEFRNYGFWAGRLRATLAQLESRGEGDSLLAAKLHDLALVIEDYEAFLAGRYVDPDGHLDIAAERLALPNTFHGAHVWVDGFASFTGQEERVLLALMRVAAEVKIALCLDGHECGAADTGRDENRPAKAGAAERLVSDNPQSTIHNPQGSGSLSMFALLEETRDRLTELARREGLLVLPPRWLPEPGQPTRFTNSPALALLERRLFAFSSPNPQSVIQNLKPKIENPHWITLTAAADQRCEVRDVAAEILRLCREEGFRFREIAVIVRDLVPYQALIETIFSDYEIPHFIDIRRDVAHHPLVELVRAALGVVVRRWASEEVIRFAKTDLAPLERAAVDKIENYVLEHGIEGDAWYDPNPWGYLSRPHVEDDEARVEPAGSAEDKEIDDWRRTLAAPLRRFEQSLYPAENSAIGNLHSGSENRLPVAELCRALYTLLEEIKTAQRLEQWAAEAEAAGRLTEADEHRQVWEAVISVLDQAVSVMRDTPVTLEEFREILESGLEGLRLRLVPPSLDEVLVGSIERSRHPAVRAAFVLGVNERVFPRPQLPDIIFGDRDRDRLAREGIVLGPVSDKRLLHEQFLAYVAFTRPSERLYVSHAEADPMGKPLHPSVFIEALRRAVEPLASAGCGLRERCVGREETVGDLAHWRGAMSGLAAGLRRGGDRESRARTTWMALYGEMRRQERWRAAMVRRLGGLVYENRASLGLETARQLYGLRSESSVSRLECFAACPFKHFARYGLGLKERLRFRLESYDLGLLYHAVLHDVFRQLSGGRPLRWGAVEVGRAAKAVEAAVERQARLLHEEVLLTSGRLRYLLEAAKAALRTFVEVLIAAGMRDRFCQAAAEIEFSSAQGARYGPLEVILRGSERLWLRGRIDRIDVGCEKRDAIRIVDYKSRPKIFDLAELVHGLTLQLPAYLLAVARGSAERGKQPQIAGALYMPILRRMQTCEPEEGFKDAEAEELDLKAWKARGLFDLKYAALFDAEVMHDKGWSPVISFGVTKEGAPYKNPGCDHLESGVLDQLLRWTERKMAELGCAILDGNVAVSPYRLRVDIPCGWCEFYSVCRFDGHREPYRVLPKMKRDKALLWMQKQMQPEGLPNARSAGDSPPV